MDKIPVYLRKPIFEKLFGVAEYSKLTKEEKQMYDNSLKYKWDNKNVLDYAVKEARREGVQQGIIQERAAIAAQMKKEGLSVSQIAKFLNLPPEDVEKL